ncbi:hypothetical protein ABZ816_41385 [Actinosynnema sp. NPDC047251]|uniref:Putative membrane protein n=1 Tax=Saccharothrix espanaensis (strain ATCC 51144 / DSM 44229 / JCM 9112 / NBRC 15066 / NRRL 15764) TaxID=1179773 RepID=K0K0R4_SACES|nr:hypothetical protein [Saccharothrix espanaensis]CCH30133.1 putative membrane protein [Saccharothrix espanaensis DSM 44229]
MTDPVDELLHEAGARWRAEQPPVPPLDPARLPRRSPVRWWLPAAAAVVVVVAGVVMARIVLSSGAAPEEPATFGTGVVTSPDRPAADLVVHEGDRLRGTGQVEVVAGRAVRFCTAVFLVDLPRPQTCEMGVPVTGVDPSGLTSLETDVTLEGVWRSGTLEVTRQSPPTATTTTWQVPDPVPCAPPPGGWLRGDPPIGKDLGLYVQEEAPDRFRMPQTSYPDGYPETTAALGDAVQVMVVEVVDGDVDAAGRELRARYTGNLCVVAAPGRPSIADQRAMHARAEEVLRPLMNDPSNGIHRTGGGDRIEVGVLMVTPELAEKFAPIRDIVDFDPWLRPW